jgi:methyl-accepting chemotaxis protein
MRLSKLSLRTLLMLVCVTVACVPLAGLSVVLWRTTNTMADKSASEFGAVASSIGDKIDRNLFERYGDVQAFGLNSVIQDKHSWYEADESNPIVQAMNQYVDTYDIYYLTVLVDLDGKLIAVNDRDDSGNKVQTEALYGKDFSQEGWFKDALAGRYYESEDGSFSGTVVEHLHVDQDVSEIYGDEGLALGFTAPVRGEDGETIAIWKNVAKFSLVEEIVMSSYQELAKRSLDATEITLLDDKGNVIVDYDPSHTGNQEMVRDMSVIGKFNLAQKGVEAAQNVVAGETGSITHSFHARKEIYQCAGYKPLSGALGFPGMKWNVLVRVPTSQALASANSLKSLCIATLVGAMVLILVGSYLLARSISNVISKTVKSLHAAENRDYSVRVETELCSDLKQMTSSLNGMLGSMAAFEDQATDYEGQIEAIGRAQAVIEFDLDGTIRKANDNFLATVGYSMEEIVGKHHRIFAEPSFANSDDYTRFWEKLSRGEFVSGEHKRVAKGGREIWIQASYNPVCDKDGNPIKVVKFATEITDQVLAKRDQALRNTKVAEFQKNEVSQISSLMAEIAAGDLTQQYIVADCDADTEAEFETFSSIASALNNMCSNLRDVIGSVTSNAERLRTTSTGLNSTANELSSGASETTHQSATVASAAEEMANNMRNMSTSTEQMTGNVNTVAKSVEELTSSISEIARTAEQSSTIASRAADLTKSSNMTIGELGSAAEEIGKVIEVIQDIAEQTNLLALNATIEAARAGDAGKGFAVVATEVKELARQTAGATEDIRNRIQIIQGSTTEAVRSIKEVGDVIEEVNQTSGTIASAVEEQSILTQGIAENINETAQQTSAVASGVAESATACDDVARSIGSVDEASRKTAAGATETQSIGDSLSSLSEELAALVGKFKIKTDLSGGSRTGAPIAPASSNAAGYSTTSV